MIAPGTVLQNRYVVERPVGEGGMGAVYIATDRRFGGSTVALKETFFDDPSLRRAFEREARLLNRLRHAALPRVSDHFDEGAGQFLVMEYISGLDLSQMLKERDGSGFPASQVLGWADQLLDALDYLHTQDPPVIHRDIKPQNLKLTARNQIVLLDFGLAKGTPLQTRITSTGSVFGYSFNYAPIEQMQGAGTDPRSDLYSLGATLYHMLTGATPPDALTRATAVLNGDPDPLLPANDTDAHVPTELADVLSRAMALSASKRFDSASEMRAALSKAARAVALEETGAGATITTAIESEQKTRIDSEQKTGIDSEQKTRLLDANDAARTSQHSPRANATNVVGTQDAATLVNTYPVGVETDSAGGESAGVATGVGANVGRVLDDKRVPDDKSVVTRVAVAGDIHAARGPRRALGVGAVAGVVVLVLVAAAVYSFTRRAANDTSVEQATPQATVEPAQQTPTPAAAQMNDSAPSSSTKTPPVNDSAHAAAQPHHTPAATAVNTKTPEENRNAQNTHVAPPPAPPALAEPNATNDDAEADDDSSFRGRDLVNNPPTREELRRLGVRPQKQARMLRRIMQERRRRGLPTPP
jgi:serine/threonine protein kinase